MDRVATMAVLGISNPCDANRNNIPLADKHQNLERSRTIKSYQRKKRAFMPNLSKPSAPGSVTESAATNAKTIAHENNRNMDQRFPMLARVLFGIMSLFWAAFGWIIILQGSFSGHTRQSKSVYTDGSGAIGMAFLAFAFAALGVLVLLRIYERKWPLYLAAMALLFIPPAAFVMLKT